MKRQLNHKGFGKREGLTLRKVLMTDPARLPDPLRVIASWSRAEAQQSAVIYRDYTRPDRESFGHQLRQAAKARRIPFLVAGDIHLCVRLRADGLHLPAWSLQKAYGLRRLYPKLLMTSACHSQAELSLANKAKLDAVLISPIFPTASHPDGKALGIIKATALAQSSTQPCFALGGIDHKSIQKLGSVFHGIAGIGLFRI